MTRVEPLSPLDAAFLHMESARTPIHMGSIGIFEGDPLRDRQGRLRMDEIRAEVESRLHLVPKLRRRVRFPLAKASMPVWADDPHFDIAQHVREAALPEPGDEFQLLQQCAALMATPLDRDRPLWQIWMIDGLSGGRVALMELLHHSMADGLAGVELATVLLDLSPRPAPHHIPQQWEPAPPPGRLTVAATGLARRGSAMRRFADPIWHALCHPSAIGRALSLYGPAFASLASVGISTPGCSLNVPVGCDRRAVVVRRSMDDLRCAERHFGVTLNDLLLTAIAAGMHDVLSSRGEVMEGRDLHVLVPVGSDHHGDHQLGNNVSAMVVSLPIGALGPTERLRAVAGAERTSKGRHQALATDLVLTFLDAWPPAILSAATPLVHHQPFVNLVVTNVPGPDAPLYVLGARMLEAVPLVPLGGNLSVGVAALSYAGQLTLGILADPVACPDVGVLADGVDRCFAALVDETNHAASGTALPVPA
jgi:diacylglycerol O-acyltransferase / wax synthase